MCQGKANEAPKKWHSNKSENQINSTDVADQKEHARNENQPEVVKSHAEQVVKVVSDNLTDQNCIKAVLNEGDNEIVKNNVSKGAKNSYLPQDQSNLAPKDSQPEIVKGQSPQRMEDMAGNHRPCEVVKPLLNHGDTDYLTTNKGSSPEDVNIESVQNELTVQEGQGFQSWSIN